MRSQPFGIFFLANDAVAGWFVPAIRSVRHHAPNVPIAVIPFDDETRRIRRVASSFGAEIVADDLAAYDSLGGSFFEPGSVGAQLFRKLKCFDGPFEQFLYLDVDLVVTPSFRHLLVEAQHEFGGVRYLEADMASVYRSPLANDLTTAGAVGANTGCFASARDSLSLEDAQAAVSPALAVREHFAPTGEQPFLNYCVDRSSARWTRFDCAMDSSCIVGQPGFVGSGPIVHWAGRHLQPGMGNDRAYLRWAVAGVSSVSLYALSEYAGRGTIRLVRRTIRRAR